jgi:hypothetical protein
MIAPDRITTELDAALKDYTAGNDCAVRFVTIDQVDMLAEFYLHNRATEAKLAKAVEALLLARVHVANNEQGWSVGRASARSDLKIINATLAEIEGTNAP